MLKRFHEGVAPAYLFLCLILGGSAQGIWANMVLQLLGLVILGWAALAPAREPLLPPARQLLVLAIIALAIVAFQLVPLPGTWWPHLPGRGQIARDFLVLGIPVPPLPLSLTPYGSLSDLLALIPPVDTAMRMRCPLLNTSAVLHRSTLNS